MKAVVFKGAGQSLVLEQRKLEETNMKDFAGKIIFITGGASGIGLETGRQLAQQGAHIVVLDCNPTDAAHEALEAARRLPSQRVARYQMDIANRQEVLDVVAKAVAECGTPDLLINSAGTSLLREFLNTTHEGFDRVMQVNLYGTRHICEAIVPFMVERGQGRIVLVASMAGHVGIYGYTNYSTSKFAVRGFAEALRYELKPLGISVQCLCPGEVDTPMGVEEQKNMLPATWALKKTAGTVSVDVPVDDLLKGLRSNKQMIVTGGMARVAYWINRLTPQNLWYAICDRLVKGALDKEG
jgi:NAD(P)-dependent dehydrogenase (short-subunit alcohol dehydrogenase family)